MKLIVNLKLKPLESQHSALLETLKEANKACNWISQKAFENKIFSQFHLHKIVYKEARQMYNLSSQMVIRSIAKVADSYQIQKAKQTVFRDLGSIAYDDRIISFKQNNLVSIWTTEGRLNIPFVCGEHQQKLLQYRKGEVDLIFRKGDFYLNAVCDVPEESPLIPDDIIGVDFGIVQIATTSNGENFSGKELQKVREKFSFQRQILQHKASKQSNSGKRPRNIHKLIKRLSGRERNFRHHTNHVISKKLVENAKALNCGLAFEELKGIRKRIEPTVNRQQRAKISGWSFFDLREKVTYKAKLQGVLVFFVDAKNTSRTCSKCGHCEKANRKNQAEFECVKCHFSLNADANAAINIRGKAVVTRLQKSENIDLQKSL